jgi:hypothetical protein
MKIILIKVALLALCLISSAELVAVGSDFGRTWISNYLAQNPRPAVQDNNNTLTGWGGIPKVIEQNDSSSNTDWLGEHWLKESTFMDNQTPLTNYSTIKLSNHSRSSLVKLYAYPSDRRKLQSDLRNATA